MATIILQGKTFDDLPGFYNVLYGLMTLDQDWYPAHSLDALNDVLYSGFGTGPVTLIWQDSEKNRADLGRAATAAFYQRKIDQGKPYNVVWARQQLDALTMGTGQTLFEIMEEILNAHKHINLLLR